LDFGDYKEEMEKKLDEKYVDDEGVERAKYVKSSDKELKKEWKQVQQIVEQGRVGGYISEGDAKLMVPEQAKAGRLYGLVKSAKSVTMDVSALYPSVPHHEGLNSLGTALENRTDKSVPTSFLVSLMKMVLTMNTFVWDSRLYTQQQGTAIGTRSAPTFAGLFMGELERKLLEIWTSLGPDCTPEDWVRFIDDILF
jgi:hypothetical protein